MAANTCLFTIGELIFQITKIVVLFLTSIMYKLLIRWRGLTKSCPKGFWWIPFPPSPFISDGRVSIGTNTKLVTLSHPPWYIARFTCWKRLDRVVGIASISISSSKSTCFLDSLTQSDKFVLSYKKTTYCSINDISKSISGDDGWSIIILNDRVTSLYTIHVTNAIPFLAKV